VTNSINLFPVEERQTLRTEKLKVNFRFNSYNSYIEIKNNSKELQIYFDSKIIQNQILENIKALSVSYSHDVEYTEELFKIIVSKIDKMTEEKQDELAKYFVENINQEVKK
jgi:RecB family endonuclease NucS